MNGYEITYSDIEWCLRSLYGNLISQRKQPDRWRGLLEAGVESEVRDRLLVQAARVANSEIDQKAFSSAMQRSNRLLGEERYQSLRAERRRFPGGFAEFLRRRMLIDKFQAELAKAEPPDEATLRSYCEGHRKSVSKPGEAGPENRVQSFDEVRLRIEAFLENRIRHRKLDDWFEQARQRAEIRYFPFPMASN